MTQLLQRALVVFVALAAVAPGAQLTSVAELRRAFDHPPDDSRIMMRWWWFGPAVTKPELEREMRAMKQGGIGGFEVQPVYPLALDDPEHGFRNLPYLSPEFLDSLQFTGAKARELGLRMDLTLGSGWPYGGPHIPIAEAASALRMERIPIPAHAASIAVPKIVEGDKLIAAFIGTTPITGIEDGIARFPADGAERAALFIIAGRTRQMVKRAAVGAEGFVLDHYDGAAIETHLKNVGEPMLAALAATPPYAIFSDSLEVYNADWTGDFLAEFRKRRGYDLTPHLPALFTDLGGQAMAIRHDWGKTLTELANENY
ncbi:MAG TPA: glycosyl hydrolase, partial [Bryobacteraceae bacterium]|nr:glycosyl hydrolase [Bryobacteraceae bacterium]